MFGSLCRPGQQPHLDDCRACSVLGAPRSQSSRASLPLGSAGCGAAPGSDRSLPRRRSRRGLADVPVAAPSCRFCCSYAVQFMTVVSCTACVYTCYHFLAKK